MYIFELINKLQKQTKSSQTINDSYFEETDQNIELEDITKCNHSFMPIDSTKTVLACTKCGHIIKNTKMKFNETDKNPFLNL